MTRYMIISWVVGMLNWTMDGVIAWNPYARKLFQGYKANMKATINIPKAFFIYLFYGFVVAGFFIVLYKSLPGEIGILKGLSFAVMAWFFRGFMLIMTQWMMFPIPSNTLVYVTIAGLSESLILGMLLGLTLKG